MTAQDNAPSLDFALSAWLEELRQRTLAFALPGLGVLAAVILGSLGLFGSPLRSLLMTVGLFALGGLVWALLRWRYLAAALALLVGALIANALVLVWSGLDVVLVLLLLPVGLATLTLSRAAGLLTALLCSIGVLAAPAARPVQAVALIAIWGTLGLLWLTLAPLLTAVSWAWASHERSHGLLEQSRDYQQRLHETLDDLADANRQLARLNQQAQALRQVAEDERRAKQEFVANVSHELRTPLNMIVGFCEMITKAPEAYGDVPPSLLADLAVVLRNGQHLSHLIDDVLDMSQIAAEQMALSKAPVPLAEIVEAVTVAVRPLFASKGLYLKTDIPEDIPPLFCDRTRIREVLLNLLSNAGRFTETGGVRVRARQREGYVVFSVADTGPGIAAADQARIFRPFQQLDGSIRRRYGGTGLGLSISKSFVELHGGEMWLESEVGAGTTFFFSLPLVTPVTEASAAEHPARWITPGWEFLQRTHRSRVPPVDLCPRVLVVERGQAMGRLLSRYLDGVEVTSAPDLERAVEALARAPAQALLVNAMSVDRVLRRLEACDALPPDVPVIAYTVPGAEQMADGLGVFDYLVKPVSQEMLLASLARMGRPVETILVVDDEPDALRLFRRMLLAAERGYRVVRASDGQQAWALLQQDPVDVILLDLMMPEMSGFQLLDLKRQAPELRDIPVILISARDPLGQPIVSQSLAVTRQGGLSVPDLLAATQALMRILCVGDEPPADEGARAD
jgi:signal transduction histidine kinase/DNA-binding response OmpR family regulator